MIRSRREPEFDVADDICVAKTPPGGFYGDPGWFARQVEVLERAWHMAPLERAAPCPGHAIPWTMLPGCVDEPLVWTRDSAGARRCLSNVCTHRGHVLVQQAGPREILACRYHGRCFGLDGVVRAAPGFTGLDGFPTETDHLAEVGVGEFVGFAFAALRAEVPFDEWIGPLREWLAFLDDRELPGAPTWSREYEFDAHWALYVDNYLEGFHIPHVHRGLQRTIEPGQYSTELFATGSIQVAFSRRGEPVLALPAAHRWHDHPVAGIYAFLFPCTMLNVYPWGVSLNLVEPLAPRRTRVRYLQYVSNPELRHQGAGGDLETVEFEDQAVVLATQAGISARLYGLGRYAPEHERAVHHFHRAMALRMAEPQS